MEGVREMNARKGKLYKLFKEMTETGNNINGGPKGICLEEWHKEKVDIKYRNGEIRIRIRRNKHRELKNKQTWKRDIKRKERKRNEKKERKKMQR